MVAALAAAAFSFFSAVLPLVKQEDPSPFLFLFRVLGVGGRTWDRPRESGDSTVIEKPPPGGEKKKGGKRKERPSFPHKNKSKERGEKRERGGDR